VATGGDINVEDTFIRFDKIYERDGQTDGQSPQDGRQRPCLCIASREKKSQFSTDISLYLGNDRQ